MLLFQKNLTCPSMVNHPNQRALRVWRPSRLSIHVSCRRNRAGHFAPNSGRPLSLPQLPLHPQGLRRGVAPRDSNFCIPSNQIGPPTRSFLAAECRSADPDLYFRRYDVTSPARWILTVTVLGKRRDGAMGSGVGGLDKRMGVAAMMGSCTVDAERYLGH